MRREWETLGGRLFRRARRAILIWLLWREQGQPRELPVVFQEGVVLVCPHDYRLVTGWGWDFRYRTGGRMDAEWMADRLVERYGSEPTEWIDGCSKCVVTS